MTLREITAPINEDLEKVNEELNKIVAGFESEPSRRILEYYFKVPGKLLRPSLLLLSAGAANPDGYPVYRQRLYKTAAAIELIHNASLIHDDIVDGEISRRGRKTLNNAYGNKIAVMAGNILFTRAVSIVIEELPGDICKETVQLVRKMSSVEVRQQKGNILDSREDYLELIKGKTALLMGHACRLGAVVGGGDENTVHSCEQFGINFGFTYQIVDDHIDRDEYALRHVTMADAEAHALKAVSYINGFAGSEYRTALAGMLDYILGRTHFSLETGIKSVVR